MSRTSTMTAEEFRALRESTQASFAEWAHLLRCTPGAVKNMECKKPIGEQMALLATLMAHPQVRALLPEIFLYKENILRETRKKALQ